MLTVGSLQRQVENYAKARLRQDIVHITFDGLDASIVGKDGIKLYAPSPTGEKFHQDDALVRCIMGPYGSGKTTICLHEMVRRACAMPAWYHGRRKSRAVVIRNTVGELTSTTLKSWLSWFEDLGTETHRQKPILTYEHVYNDGKGIVDLEIVFLALDRPDDISKLKSIEFTWAYMNEASELPRAVLDHLKGRVGRYPSKQQCPQPFWRGIMCDTNGPDEDHWIPSLFKDPSLDNHHIYYQPAGLIRNEETKEYETNPEAENIENLPPNYYVDLAKGQTQEFINVYCLGKYGTVGSGMTVYPSFNSDLHAQRGLQAIQGLPIYLAWDFGLTPACLVVQMTPMGTILVLKEYFVEGMAIKSFAESVVLPGLKIDFPYNKIGLSIADPAGAFRSEQIDDLSCIGILNMLGIETRPARTNDIAPRLGAVNYFLNKLIDGKPAFVVDIDKCPLLYKGFIKGYLFKRIAIIGEERYKDVPDKNKYSHTHDCCQYICLELASTMIQKEKQVEHDFTQYSTLPPQVF